MIKKRLYGLDLLKIFAIIWIGFYHFLDFRNNWSLGIHFNNGNLFQYFLEYNSIFKAAIQSFLSLGILGVNIFIIASGLGLSISANNKKLSLLGFFKKRLFRIYPHYWHTRFLPILSI